MGEGGKGGEVHRSLLSRLLPFASVLFFGAALFLLHKELAGFHYKDVIRFLSALPLERVLQALGFTVLSYLTLIGYDILGFRYVGKVFSYWKVSLAAYVGYAFSNALGFPLLTGTPVRLRFYASWGLSALEIARVVLFSIVTFWLGYLGLGGAAFLMDPLPLPDAMQRWVPFGIVDTRPLGVLCLLLTAAYLVASVLWHKPVLVRGVEVALPRPRLALLQVADGMLDWALAAAVLYSLLPSDWKVSYPALLGAFLLAQAAGLLSQVPSGLGVFETMMLLLLPQSLPRAEVLAALVAFRGVYYFLPVLLAAVLLGGHEVAQRRTQVGRIARMFGERAPDVVPQVLALTTFVGGAILLASGATPALHTRLSWLSDTLPLPVIEISHFLGSLAGVALLFLAIGLQRRLDAAYQLTLLMLASGAVFSLLKGLDWEEALILTCMLAALAPCHAHFNRKASLTSQPFTPGWITAIAIVLGGSLWLGFFAYKHVDYSHDLWWHFAFFGNAPRFLRASVGVAAVALGVALGRLLRPAPPEPSWPTPEDLDKAGEVASRFPRTFAYLALLGDKELLFNDERTAFLMYGIEKRSWVAMGDPVGPEDEQTDLAWRFRELCDRHGGWAVFYQVSGRNLPLYVDLGLSLIKLGEEARVPLAGFSLEGRSRKKLRHAHRRGLEDGLRVEIVLPESVPDLLPELDEISDEWLHAKNTREKGFSLGRFDPDYLKRLPLALVRQGDGQHIIAFANLWPGGDKDELSIDLMRHREDAPAGVMDFLLLDLMLWGSAEGYRWFNLGMAPLSGLEGRALAPLWSRLGALVFRHGEHYYNFQGLRQYKDKFDPVWEPRYLACPGGLGGLVLPRVLADVAALISGGFRGVVAK